MHRSLSPRFLASSAAVWLSMAAALAWADTQPHKLTVTSPTKVLISIAHAMGVAVTSFGSGAFVDTSPMAGINA